jgi:hypothetical protein
MRETAHKFFVCGNVVCSVEDYKYFYKPRRLVTGAGRQETKGADCLRHITIRKLIPKPPHLGVICTEGT